MGDGGVGTRCVGLAAGGRAIYIPRRCHHVHEPGEGRLAVDTDEEERDVVDNEDSEAELVDDDSDGKHTKGEVDFKETKEYLEENEEGGCTVVFLHHSRNE